MDVQGVAKTAITDIRRTPSEIREVLVSIPSLDYSVASFVIALVQEFGLPRLGLSSILLENVEVKCTRTFKELINEYGFNFQKSVLSVLVTPEVPSFLFELQSQSNTCFRHAINHYLQRDYTRSDLSQIYKQILLKHQDKVQEIRTETQKPSFYGDAEVPHPSKLDEFSPPEVNDDLNSYFSIYSATSVADFVDTIIESDFKELSPVQALFVLEFQLSSDFQSLHYVPHRFYHRYARSTDESDQDFSKKYFTDLLNSERHKAAETIFLAHTTPGFAHAFGARKQADQWFLMDSLLPNPRRVQQNSFFHNFDEGGRASILLIRDGTKESRVIG